MILRKPFKILIKHFKLIHLVMLGLMIYVTYNTNQIVSFLNEYMGSTLSLITHESFLVLFKTSTFACISLIFIVNLIILGLMWFKKKPVKVYIYNIITFIYTLIILMIARNIIGGLEIALVEVRTLKLVQDLLVSSVLLEAVSLGFIAIRATGFDVKNFDFKHDLEEFDITSADNEEFELNLDVDTDKIRRKVNRGFRYSKYIYVENKYVFGVLFLVVFSFVCGLIYLNMSVYNKKYTENETFNASDFIINIERSYVTKYDYRGNLIDKDYQFVILKLKIKSKYGKAILKTGKFALRINEHNLYPVSTYLSEFKDLGYNYNDNELNNNFSDYILVYKIPNSYEDDKMEIRYYDTLTNDITTKLMPINLNKKENEVIYNLNEQIDFDDSILMNSNVVVNSFEISDNFRSDYEFCHKGECFSSYEYVKPELNSSYDKSLIKLSGKFNYGDKLKIVNIKSLYEFVKMFGSLSYQIGDEEKFITSEFAQISPKKSLNKNLIYLEVPKEVESASSISLHFKIRNKDYVYKLR